ncbi:MAG: hypothetical protein IJ984_00330, partial [Prevotella sp.]|nr:hypothetical protein [Prevotella sp.]
ASQAYDRVTNTSLNVTAGSDGRVELKEIGRNRYAYFVGMSYNDKTLTASDYIVAGSNVYYLNDPITYWDWSRLSEEEKRFFTDNPNKDTYICNKDFTVDDQSFTKGEVITHIAYEALAGKTIKNEEDEDVSIQTYFNISNAVSKDNGFLLTIDISNPAVWDDYYNSQTGNNKKLGSKLTTEEKAQMLLAPTFTCTSGGIFGQQSYKEHDLIDETTKTNYDAITQQKPADQATVEKAYIAKKNLAVVVGNQTYHYVEGACMSLTHYNALSETDKLSSAAPAYICTETVKMNDESGQHYIYGVAISDNEYNELRTANDALYSSCFEPAYICTSDGYYGGKYFEANKNYPALDYCGVNKNERGNFKFNEDAFDLLRLGFDLTDDSQVGEHGAPWSEKQRVDYTAIFSSSEEVPTDPVKVSYVNAEGETKEKDITIQSGMEPLDNYVYEALPNEQARYSQITIGEEDKDGCYIVKTTFFTGDKMYRAGTKLTKTEYNLISDNLQSNMERREFDSEG